MKAKEILETSNRNVEKIKSAGLSVTEVKLQNYNGKYYGKAAVNAKGYNNCAPIAISAATGVDYNKVNSYLISNNFRISDNKGTRTGLFVKANYRAFREVSNIYNHGSVTAFAVANPTGTFLVRVNKHLLTVKDGVVYNTVMKGYSMKVIQAWELIGEINF